MKLKDIILINFFIIIFSYSIQISAQEIKPGAYQIENYLSIIDGKNIAIVGNQSSELNNVSLVDTLLSLNQNIVKIFSPEHGFRGKADAGEKIIDEIDKKTGLKVISLYGKNKKPLKVQLEGIDAIVFDLQDVGVRFYTYISTLHYIMESCAENDIPLIVLDRPNPNAHYVDGPLLDKKYKSFVGMHPVPIVYGMTIGEYARMINGEKWLNNEIQCDLKVIKIKDYNHTMEYNLPLRPSPNLPNSKSINLYPSLCFFEGTPISAGRGTEMQFQIFGSPKFSTITDFEFTPFPNFGSKHPKYNNEKCFGRDLRNENKLFQINLEWLIEAYELYPEKEKFFNQFFAKLAGSNKLQIQIEKGLDNKTIRKSWQTDLAKFKIVREKYLLYR